MRLTQRQQMVYNFIKAKKECYVSEIAKHVFKNIRLELRPLDTHNSVIVAINQINKKYDGLIKTYNRGCKGKIVYI